MVSAPPPPNLIVHHLYNILRKVALQNVYKMRYPLIIDASFLLYPQRICMIKIEVPLFLQDPPFQTFNIKSEDPFLHPQCLSIMYIL